MYVQAFDRQGLLARAAPFLLAIGVAFALTPLQPYDGNPNHILFAVVVASAIVVAVAFLPWQRLPRYAQSVPALGFFGVVVLLSEASGGANSAYGPLVFLPVVWVALYGERWELVLALGGVTATFFGPLVLAGGPAYSATEWRWAIAAVFVA